MISNRERGMLLELTGKDLSEFPKVGFLEKCMMYISYKLMFIPPEGRKEGRVMYRMRI
jgi:hypothetical protein